MQKTIKTRRYAADSKFPKTEKLPFNSFPFSYFLIFLNIFFFVWKQGHLLDRWSNFSDNFLVVGVSNIMELFIYAAVVLWRAYAPDLSIEYSTSKNKISDQFEKEKQRSERN